MPSAEKPSAEKPRACNTLEVLVCPGDAERRETERRETGSHPRGHKRATHVATKRRNEEPPTWPQNEKTKSHPRGHKRATHVATKGRNEEPPTWPQNEKTKSHPRGHKRATHVATKGAPGDAERRETERRETEGLHHLGSPRRWPPYLTNDLSQNCCGTHTHTKVHAGRHKCREIVASFTKRLMM